MTDQQEKPAKARALRTNRMEAFSDGVFAIAITLLVLEIALPSGSEGDLLGAVVSQWPTYLAYLVSFSTIGAVWLEHTVTALRRSAAADGGGLTATPATMAQ